jgi:hypothetical protein
VTLEVPAVPPSEALMVALPVEIALAKPLALMLTTLEALEVQPAELVTLPTEPSENVAEAVNCCWVTPPVPDTLMVAGLGFTVIDMIVLLLTVRGAVAVALLFVDFAVMVAVPSATAVTNPALSMVATFVFDDSHVTLSVTSPLVLLPKIAVAVNCCVFVGVIQPLVGDRERDVIESEAGKKPLQLPRSRAEARVIANLPHRFSRCISNILIVLKPRISRSENPATIHYSRRRAPRERVTAQIILYANVHKTLHGLLG